MVKIIPNTFILLYATYRILSSDIFVKNDQKMGIFNSFKVLNGKISIATNV